MSVKDPKQYAAIITGKILEFLERSFPNTISVDELARLTETEPGLVNFPFWLGFKISLNTNIYIYICKIYIKVYDFLRDLSARGLVKYYDNGNTWIRNIVNTQDEQTHG